MDAGYPWRHALWCVCLDDLGGSGVVCESGGWLGQKDITIRAILEPDDVVSDSWKPHNYLCLRLDQQRHILLGLDHIGM